MRARSFVRRVIQRIAGPQKHLSVPPQFNRNSPTVTALMTPEQSGRWLLERMRQAIGFDSYDRIALLDFGCGVRFSQAIINTQLNIGSYAGVDNYKELVEFLNSAVRDARFSYAFLNAHHAIYNPKGRHLQPQTRLPLKEQSFDVVSMFSVITHQDPEEAATIFAMLERYVKRDGRLFFTCFLDESIASFEDRSPEGLKGERCYYNPAFLTELIEQNGWVVVGRAPREAPLIGDSFVCRPVGV